MEGKKTRQQVKEGTYRLTAAKDVLLIIDFINPLDFPGAKNLLPGAWRAAKATHAFKIRLAQRGIPAIYANDNYGLWQSEFHDVWERCCVLRGRRGQIAQLLEPSSQDLAILKPKHSAFYATPLEVLLREMHVQRLIIVGLAADMCVHSTAVDAYMRGYSIWVPADCVAAETAQRKRNALAHLARAFKCDTRPSVENLTDPKG